MSEITISLEQVEAYIKTLSGEYDEWWMTEYDLYGTGLISFLRDVDRGFGDSANALLKLHVIEADKLEEERQDEVNKYNSMSVAEEEREDLIAKVLGRGWHGLPVDADRFKRYTTKELMCYLQKEQFESALEKEFGWIREDHFGQTERGEA